MSDRKIIHIDMDAFYASIEQRDNPNIKGKPVAVGGSGERGVIAAASYEARKYGIHSAMPSSKAKKLCPHLIFVRARFETYRQVSQQIMEIFHHYTDIVEPLSIDEAFLDVTRNKINMPSATIIAQEIKEKIYKKTSLTASAGISYNKFLAKIASDVKKPNGIFAIPPEMGPKYIEKLPVKKFHGVGKVTAERMHEMGIFTGKDIKKQKMNFLLRYFGKSGSFFYNIARGIDNRVVEPNRIRKSVGIEETFSSDISGHKEVSTEIENLKTGLLKRLDKNDFKGKTLTLKVKYANFDQITRSKTTYKHINEKEIDGLCQELVSSVDINQSIRLLGLSISNTNSELEAKEAIQLKIPFEGI